MGEILYEPAVEVGESQEWLDLLLICGGWPFNHSGDLNRVHSHRVVGDNNTEVLNLCLLKLTFLWFQVEVMLLEEAEDFLGDLLVLFQCISEYEDVVQIHYNLPLSDQLLKDSVHHGLECGQAVSESEEHD